MKRKIVYIAHPIANDVSANMRSLREKVKHFFDYIPDMVPLVPYYVYVDSLSEFDRIKGMYANFDILRSGCISEVWLMGDHISNGMNEEISIANEMGIPIVYKLDDPINQCIGENLINNLVDPNIKGLWYGNSTPTPNEMIVIQQKEIEELKYFYGKQSAAIEDLRIQNGVWFEKYNNQEKEMNEVKETNRLLNQTIN